MPSKNPSTGGNLWLRNCVDESTHTAPEKNPPEDQCRGRALLAKRFCFGGLGETFDTHCRFLRFVRWLRSIRMEFPCAFYQLRARSNRLGTVFRDEEAHRIFWTPTEAIPPHSSTPLPVPSVSGPVSARDPNVKNLSRCPPRPTTTTLTTPPSASASGFRISFRSFTAPQGSPMIWLVRAVGFERGAFAR